jgi:hypothetical protein
MVQKYGNVMHDRSIKSKRNNCRIDPYKYLKNIQMKKERKENSKLVKRKSLTTASNSKFFELL